MFIWEFAADLVLGQIVNWVYNQVVGFLGNFFAGDSVRDKKGTNRQLVPFLKFSLS